MAKILLHTLGSAGDFNPFMALALELRRRGHDIHWAVSPKFAARAQAQGFAATVSGPDPDWDSALMRRLLTAHPTDPVRLLYEEVLIPAIGPAAEALEPLVKGCDLFLSHVVQLAAPAVADRTGVPWVSASAATLVYETGDYPPPGVAWKGCPAWLSKAGWEIGYRLFGGLDAQAAGEYHKLGVAPRPFVVAGGAYSRRLTLGLWSPSFFPRPSDWPAWFQIGGYARWDGSGESAPPEALPEKAGGAPLVVFTLGSSVVNYPGVFWAAALSALEQTNWRGVLLGAPADLPIPRGLRDRVQSVPYAPYTELFPLADAIVHQGGVGTTQAACFYGIPALVVPRGFDQFENAAHLQREGWGLRLLPQHFSAYSLRVRLERLLSSPRIRARTQTLGHQMQAEPGVAHSADLVEAALG